MRKPRGRLTDVLDLPDDETGQPRTLLMLDQLTHVPEAGDVLQVADNDLPIAHVDGRRTRSCLAGWKLAGRGSVGVLINTPPDALRPLVKRKDRLFVTWTPKDRLHGYSQTDDLPVFSRLNEDWNAHPNDVGLKIEQKDQTLLAHMRPNPYAHRKYEKIPAIKVRFENCERYRLTPVNDHGWYGGQCRFGGLAPSWGEFYEISGDTRDHMDPTPWTSMAGTGKRHFHFYLKDQTLEVKAHGWALDSKT